MTIEKSGKLIFYQSNLLAKDIKLAHKKADMFPSRLLGFFRLYKTLKNISFYFLFRINAYYVK